MTVQHEVPATTLDRPSRREPTLETESRTPVLITEPEVAFSTAAAVPVQPTGIRWWITAIGVAVHRFLTTPVERRRYLEYGVMKREIHRL